MINFKPINNFKPGQIHKLVKICYQGLIEYFPNEKQRLYHQWENEDKAAFQNMNTIGRQVLFTCFNDKLIGYFCWDDRQYPIGMVGQNCILPDYQGLGYGMKQIEMIKNIFKDKKFEKMTAVTGDHKFFIPAQKMYEKCGLEIKEKRKGDLFELIEYIGILIG